MLGVHGNREKRKTTDNDVKTGASVMSERETTARSRGGETLTHRETVSPIVGIAPNPVGITSIPLFNIFTSDKTGSMASLMKS